MKSSYGAGQEGPAALSACNPVRYHGHRDDFSGMTLALWNWTNLGTVHQHKVTITPGRHSRMLLAGIQKKSLDARLREHDMWILDTHLCGAVLRIRLAQALLSAINLFFKG
jgi:hypothetical protein